MGWLDQIATFGRGVINLVGAPYYHFKDTPGRNDKDIPYSEDTGWATGLKQIGASGKNMGLSSILGAYALSGLQGLMGGSEGGAGGAGGFNWQNLMRTAPKSAMGGGQRSGGISLPYLISQQAVEDANRQNAELLGTDADLPSFIARQQLRNNIQSGRVGG